jgi:hypothetical protein
VWTAETVLVCALALLPRESNGFPPVVLLDTRPADVSVNAEGFVRHGDPRIYLLTDSPSFRRARRAGDRCGELQALRKIASIVVHEEWHVRHPGDERGAYDAQRTALLAAGAAPGNPLLVEVQRSMRTALRWP